MKMSEKLKLFLDHHANSNSGVTELLIQELETLIEDCRKEEVQMQQEINKLSREMLEIEEQVDKIMSVPPPKTKTKKLYLGSTEEITNKILKSLSEKEGME